MSEYDTGKHLGTNCRLTWTRGQWKLEELPVKGQRHCRVETMQNPYGNGWVGFDAFMPCNMLREHPVSETDGYDEIKAKLTAAMAAASEEVIAKLGQEKWGWLRGQNKWWENTVYFTQVMPEGSEPVMVEGKDFKFEASWTKFTVYSPHSDFQQSDPFYTGYEASAPTAARKLYQIVKKNPSALAEMSYSALDGWLKANKIGYEHISSSWH